MQTTGPTERARLDGPRVAVSTFNVSRELGPIRMSLANADVDRGEMVFTAGGPVALTDFPRLVRDNVGASAIETSRFRYRRSLMQPPSVESAF